MAENKKPAIPEVGAVGKAGCKNLSLTITRTASVDNMVTLAKKFGGEGVLPGGGR